MPFAAWTDDLLKDLRYALRQFTRNPVFTAVAVASLAIGIGANTAIFSVLNAAMLKSLPVRDPQGLVMLTDPNQSGVSSGMSSGTVDKAKGRVKEAAGALTDDKKLKGEGKADQLAGKVKDTVEKVVDKAKDMVGR